MRYAVPSDREIGPTKGSSEPQEGLMFAPNTRVFHKTSHQHGVVVSVGTQPWEQGEVRILIDGASLPLDTRECFLEVAE